MYQKTIEKILTSQGFENRYDPRHIEAYMRLEYGTLDGLSYRDFIREIDVCRQCIDMGGRNRAEECAKSFGL